MKKRSDATTTRPTVPTRRLKVKKELLRNLSPADLTQVVGGIGCPRSFPPSGCC